MQSVNDLLDRAKERAGLSKDGDLAGRLGVKPSAVSNYRHLRAFPDAVVCGKLAEMTGEKLATVLGIVGEARAISSAEKAVWRRLAQAASFALCVMGFAEYAYFQGVSEHLTSAVCLLCSAILAAAITHAAGKVARYAPTSHHTAYAY